MSSVCGWLSLSLSCVCIIITPSPHLSTHFKGALNCLSDVIRNQSSENIRNAVTLTIRAAAAAAVLVADGFDRHRFWSRESSCKMNQDRTKLQERSRKKETSQQGPKINNADLSRRVLRQEIGGWEGGGGSLGYLCKQTFYLRRCMESNKHHLVFVSRDR